MKHSLTPAFVKGAHSAPGKDREIYWDERLPGFGLMVTANGSKSFVVQYRAGRTSRRLTIDGRLPLDQARKEALKTLGAVAKGHDPLAERRDAAAMAENTLQAVAEEYFKREGKRLRTTTRRRALLRRLVYPKIGAPTNWPGGGCQIGDIKRSEINRLLDDIEDKNGPVQSDMVLAFVRRIMNWHASRSDDFNSPIVRGMARNAARRRDRILSDDELRAVWRAALELPDPWGSFVRFLFLTATRRNEPARMAWDEVKDGVWTIPGHRYKGRNGHASDMVFPLSAAAQHILEEMPRVKGCPYVFTTDARHPICAFTKLKAKLDAKSGVTGWTLHDLRRTARSLMSRASVDPDHAERCLGRVIRGQRGTYDRHKYQAEMLRAFDALSIQVKVIVEPTNNVVPMAARKSQ
jgi:integrase